MHTLNSGPAIKEAQVRLNKAFVSLRKLGLLAWQSFSCCPSCASCEIANEVETLSEAQRNRIKGAVFYTKQQGFENGKSGTYLSFGDIKTTKVGTVGISTKEVGKLVVTCLKEAGLSVTWNGKPTTCIWVDVAPPKKKVTPARRSKVNPLDRVSQVLGD
jgi:hypothetical protein